jgi:hypothetical protein
VTAARRAFDATPEYGVPVRMLSVRHEALVRREAR